MTPSTTTVDVLPAVSVPASTVSAIAELRDLIERAEPIVTACESFWRDHLPVIDAGAADLASGQANRFDEVTGYAYLFDAATRLGSALFAAIDSTDAGSICRPDWTREG